MLKTISKDKTILSKVIFTVLILILSQLITNIPVPGINRTLIDLFLNSEIGESMSFISLFSGNSLNNMSMFILGISPYITASIVLQLLRVAFPRLDEMAKDGKMGETRYKRLSYFTGGLFAVMQAFPIAYGFKKSGILVENTNKYLVITAMFLILGGIIFMLLGAAIDKVGVKNGTSLILMTNIVSRIPTDMGTIYETYIKGGKASTIVLTVVISLIVIVGLTIWTIYLQDGEERIPTQYSTHVNTTGVSKPNKSYIPLKVNVAGVMPIIFTMNMFQLYTLAVSLIGVKNDSVFKKIAYALTTSKWFDKEHWCYTLGLVLYIVLLIAFQYFYSIIQFDTEKITKNLKNTGGVIVGIRPGEDTKQFLDKKVKNMTVAGSVCLFVVAIIPILVAGLLGIHTLSLGGTSIIIIVGVLVQTYNTIESDCLESSQTSSFLW